MIDFPASPTVGQQFTAAGVTWTWDGAKWTAAGLSVAYLPLAGGLMSGPIVLAADPTAAMQPVTLQYFNARPMIGDNRLINGDMRIDQRNNGASGTAINVYTVDRWQHQASVASKGTWGRNLNSIVVPPGFPYYFGFQSSSAYTPLTNDYFGVYQTIEADMISDLVWGTPQAQPVTLSFWAQSSLTGTFSGVVANNTGTRTYPFTYPIPTANAWTKIAVTVPGDTTGTWAMAGNGGGLYVWWDFGSGATYRSPAGAWANSSALGANGAVNVVATNAAKLYLTGVKLEVGAVATPYNRQSLAKSMADCQRYFQTGFIYLVNSASTAVGQTAGCSSSHTPMRAAATTVITTNNNGNISSPVVADGGPAFYASGTATATGGTVFNLSFNASAEI